MFELRLPSFGADMDAAKFIQWSAEPGQALERGAIVAVVETQKGAIDVELWQQGTLARRVAEPGQQLPVGALLAVLASPGEDWQLVASQATVPEAAPPAAPAEAAMPALTAADTPPPAAEAMRVSPAARQRAAELGVNLSELARQLPGHTLTLADVEAAAPGDKAGDKAGAMRRAIAAAMARSKREIPHYYLSCEVEVEAALLALEAFNRERPIAARALFVAVAYQAIARALREVPSLNGHFVDGQFRPASAIHLGMVTALRAGGLLVPTLHDADRLDLPSLMSAMSDSIARARQGQMRSSDLADSTITVSSLGEVGVDQLFGVIYPPQVAIIGLGSVAARPVVRDGALQVARTLHVSLAADHRVSDGRIGARFLAAVRERLNHPEF